MFDDELKRSDQTGPDFSPLAITSQVHLNNCIGFRCNTASPITCVYWCIWFTRHKQSYLTDIVMQKASVTSRIMW